MQSAQDRFVLNAGSSRDDIAFLASVTEDGSFEARRIEMPEAVGASTQDGELLLIQRVA